ncbi:MAG: transposase [Planctomycetes bacterium]|nr:transposase [Planctomycetota bacterium]
MGLKLPWCWKTGPSTSSERDHLMEMQQSHEFPENTLFCCDAGFVGYEFWKSILDAGHSFLIRVGGNVHLLKNLGHARAGKGIVCLWPDAAARRRQEPIVLRLLEVQSERGTMYLITNVLSEHELSTPLLKRLYPLRWGVEIQFRAVKQTFGRSKLKSRNSKHALTELDWSLVALTMIQLFAIREQIKLDEPPEQTSVSEALRAIRNAMDNWHEPARGNETLTIRLQTAKKDVYERSSSKTSRYCPNYKDKPSTTKPVIKKATRKQRQAYRDFQIAC